MKILITGGTGFLGRYCAARFFKQGHDVTVLGRNRSIGENLTQRGIRFMAANLEDLPAVRAACTGKEAVIHSGGLASPWGKYASFYSANVLGTKNVLEASMTEGIKRLVYLSTPSLYFNYRNRELIRESEPLPRPRTHYARTKLLADRLVDEACARGLSCVSLRPRAIFGPGDNNVLGRLVKAGETGTFLLPGGGKSFVDLTYIDNAVDSVQLALNAPGTASGMVFNITNGEPVTSRFLVERLFEKLGRRVRIKSVPFAAAYLASGSMELIYRMLLRGEPPITRYAVGLMAFNQTLDISLAREKLGYAPKVPLKDGMERYVEWRRGLQSANSSASQWEII